MCPQSCDLIDGKFEIGLDRREVDTLGIGTRCGEIVVIVWHTVDMPEVG